MMIPVMMDDFVQNLLRDRRQGESLSSSQTSFVVDDDDSEYFPIVVSDNARVFANAVPKTALFELDNNNNDDHRTREDRRWGSNTNNSNHRCKDDRWGAATSSSDSCSTCLTMPKRAAMSPYRKPVKFQPSSPGSLTRSLLLKNLSDSFAELHYSDEELDELDSSTRATSVSRKDSQSRSDQQWDRNFSSHHHLQLTRSPERIVSDALAFDICLETSPEFLEFGEDDDDSSVSTNFSDF